jgi:gamma-glutamyltranspeptidase/glutathione hydrolase
MIRPLRLRSRCRWKHGRELTRRGHQLVVKGLESFGGAQIICRLDNGFYLGASDPRKDGQAVGF